MTTPPLTPAICDLRDFQYMPLHVQRLRDSDLASSLSGEEAFTAVILWCVAWHQVPAASLPNDDRALCKLAGFGKAFDHWLAVREGALRGFVPCSDGRLYHPVVAEVARESWQSKLKHHYGKELDRLRKAGKRGGEPVPLPTFEEWFQQAYPQGDGSSAGHPQDTPSPRPSDVAPDKPECPKDKPATSDRTAANVHPENALKGREGKVREGEASAPCDSNHTPADPGFEPVGVGPEQELPKPTPAMLAAAALVKLGLRVTSLNPELIDACVEGITAEQLVEVARAYPGKSAAYVIAAARRMKRDGELEEGSTTSTPDANAAWRRERDDELENRIIAIRHRCDVLHQISPSERDELIREAKEQHRALVERGPEDLAA